MRYEDAETIVWQALEPIVVAAKAAIDITSEAIVSGPTEIDSPGSSWAIPRMTVERVKAAKRAVAACLDEIIEAADARASAALISSPQTALPFGSADAGQ